MLLNEACEPVLVFELFIIIPQQDNTEFQSECKQVNLSLIFYQTENCKGKHGHLYHIMGLLKTVLLLAVHGSDIE